jgi:hypothetical protein
VHVYAYDLTSIEMSPNYDTNSTLMHEINKYKNFTSSIIFKDTPKH